MPKVDLELVKLILQRNVPDVRQVAQILEDLHQELQALVDEEKPPPVKKQYVILLSDPRGHLDGRDFTGWVVQIPEDESPATTEDKLIRAAYDFNATPKGRRLALKTIGEVCENLPARFLKEQQAWVRTKEPVLVVVSRNKIPTATLQKVGRGAGDD
ncbi:MAG: hypothetical protein ABSH19_02450 [Opitutales bacterium]|jgi:hypothetical protein